MLQLIKVLVLVFVLGIFTLPKQLAFAQTTIEQCCSEENSNNCCEQSKKNECHSENSEKSSEHEDCGQDCTNCNVCSASIVLINAVAPADFQIMSRFYSLQKEFFYKSPYFSTQIQNIWQPPKLV